jgi:DNA replication protein DnaC
MLNQPTEDKLHAMRLSAMADAWRQQAQDPKLDELGFDERFAMIVEAEYISRDNRRLERLLREAKLRISAACLEDVRTGHKHGLDKALVAQLGTCRWIDEHLNVLVTGPTGVGKTYFACALGQQACRRGYRTLYRRLPRLVEELTLARADGTYSKLLARLARAHVLIIDDWGITPMKDAARRDLLEIMEDRYGAGSTVVTSQLPISKWHDYIGEPTVADAILDRLVHSAYKCDLKGASRRKEKAQDKD